MDIKKYKIDFKQISLDKNLKLFDSIINTLILETPTGELRNKLTELNILHNNCIEFYKNRKV